MNLTLVQQVLKCKTCDKKFKWSQKHRVYCSIECNRKGRRNSWLKHSRTAKGRATQQRYRQSGKAKVRALKRAYNLTLEQHEQLYVDQNGCCAICKQSIAYDKMNTDHDHKTGKIRGLLCWSCNLMLGNAKDNLDTLRTAVRYLSSQ